MARKYDMKLVDLLKERVITEDFKGTKIIVKKLPDSDEEGAMDNRLYEDSKGMLKMLKFMPSGMHKMDTSEKGIKKLREMFNGIKSVPVVESKINIQKHVVTMKDGVLIDVYQYTNENTTKDTPVLYYIHGGGFFGGHHGVVEESLKLMCEKFGFNIFSVDYRLAPENPYPTGHEDCYEVLKWIYHNAETLQANKNLIFVAGDSAGGNLTQYCSTRDREDGENKVKGQMLLYPTLNMCCVEDEYFKWDISHYKMTKKQAKGLTKMLKMFGGMTDGLEPLLKISDAHNDYLNPYTRDPKNNPPTFITVGEHDYLKVESLAYGAKLDHAGVEVKTIVYNGLGHAYFDNCGVYPQCEDCIEEMGKFILEHC